MAKGDAKHPGGAPTKYKKAFCKELIDFFDIEPYIEKQRTIMSKGKPITIDMEIANDWPTLAKFCTTIGVHRDTLQEWAKKHPEFSVAIKKAKEYQESILVTNGLKGLYNPGFAIFAAKNVIGWKDRQEITGDATAPIRMIVVRERKA